MKISDDELVLKVAKALCQRDSAACGVDCEDNWKLYHESFKDDALFVLEVAEVTKLRARVREFEDAAINNPNNLVHAARAEQIEYLETHFVRDAMKLGEQRQQIKALEAEVEKLRADAERYRWLRENSTDYRLTQKDGYGGRELVSMEYLDAAIDKARGATCSRHNPCEKDADGYCARCHSEAYP